MGRRIVVVVVDTHIIEIIIMAIVIVVYVKIM